MEALITYSGISYGKDSPNKRDQNNITAVLAKKILWVIKQEYDIIATKASKRKYSI